VLDIDLLGTLLVSRCTMPSEARLMYLRRKIEKMERVARMKILMMSCMVLKALLFLSLSFSKVSYPFARDERSAVLRGTEWVEISKMNKRQ